MTNRPPLPPEGSFGELRLFTCKYSQDVEKFKKLVAKLGGFYAGDLQVPFLNVWNKPVSEQYACLYYYHEEIGMEILC